MQDEPAAHPISRRVFSVAELVGGVRELLEDRVGRVWVVGEISNLHRAGSGHAYFTLKDEEAQVRAALFRGAARRLAFQPEEGLEVLVYGELTVYEPRGDLQLLVRALEPRGLGALQLAFEQLRACLEAEGLFDPAAKRPLPSHPERVGVVTSPTGAALRDVLHVAERRHPGQALLVSPTRVQGEGAEAEIAVALERAARHAEVEVVLLVRGGGSLEDLQAFNSERVARAIRACPVPVVCGVGHETDLTIADLAADLRAPTPTAAAVCAIPDAAALRQRLARASAALAGAARGQLKELRGRLRLEWQALRAHAPRARLATQRARLVAAQGGLERSMRAHLERLDGRLARSGGRLASLSPLAVLARGYAIVRLGPAGAIVRSPAQVAAGDALSIRVADGEIAATVGPAVTPRDDESS